MEGDNMTAVAMGGETMRAAVRERYGRPRDIVGSKPWRKVRRILKPNGTFVMVGGPITNRLVGPLGKIARMWLAARLDKRKFAFFIASFNKADMETLRELL